MLKRYELHNHTTESDADLTVEQLIDKMEQDRVDVFALTDHNTVSGHRKVKRLLEEGKYRTKCVYGMEYTTYYGHILCLNLNRYVPWDAINRHKPELLFRACRDAGAIVGIAHPFAFGDPYARGCRFEMTATDFSCVDFIEIFNNPTPLREGNIPALNWWEDLNLRGERIAATAGMDLHGNESFAMQFATYLENGRDDPAADLSAAIRSGETWVSKGPVLRAAHARKEWRFWIEDTKKPGYEPGAKQIMTLRADGGTKIYELTDGKLTLGENDLPGGKIVIPKLYRDDTTPENIICVSPVIRL